MAANRDKIIPDLTESPLFLKNILESSIDYSIIALDLEGTILSWNKGAMCNYGYTAEEMVGKKNIFVLHTEEDINSGRVNTFFRKVLKEGRAEDAFERIGKEGKKFIASVVVDLRRDAYGKPLGFLLISKDISAQKRHEELEQQNKYIEETNRLKAELLTNMSHELRTPLNVIIGFTELMYTEDLGPLNGGQKQALTDVIDSAKHLLHIINDLLDHAKVESHKIIFKPEKVDLTELTNEVIANVLSSTGKKNISIETKIDTHLKVRIDPVRFKQILYNYLTNAVKFSNDPGRIEIRISPQDKQFFLLEVEDNGIGIHAQNLKRLFVAFQQLDSSLTKKYSGTGLGLSLTKHLVEAQGGKVGVSSIFGKGSIFFATLPINHNGKKEKE